MTETLLDAPQLVTPPEKGLRRGALGLIASTVIGVASTAPAYSLAATLGFVVAFTGAQTPIVVILAFIPMLFIAVGYAELNRADPDCGTTFTWATRAFGPRTGWMGGWGIVAADILVMASLAQIAGQYLFLLVGADGIGHDATNVWVLLVGLAWIAGMTWICYRGIEVSARIQQVLLTLEIFALIAFSVVALVKVGTGHAPAGHLTPALSWFNPLHISSPSAFVNGLLLMLFIYWGWDTAVAVNEETGDPRGTPGRAAVISTLALLAAYVVLTLAAQSFAGVGTSGLGLANPDNQNDFFRSLGVAVFGNSVIGSIFVHLLLLMVLTSAAACTQTTIMPTARTTLSMAVYRALPASFARIHPRYLTPTISTWAIGIASAAFYLAVNWLSQGNVIVDSVTAVGLMIAFYYGLTGFACTWYYRKTLRRSRRDLWLQGILPSVGGLMLVAAFGWSLYDDWITTDTSNSYTSWLLPFSPHWRIGGVFVIGAVSLLVGVVIMELVARRAPAFFRGEVLHKDVPTLVPESSGLPLPPMD